ncbi:hybrid sensor histidine kinase/response regulator [Rhizobium halophilum]|uniref:hybrid sensor histidine kinase/response regulator n=1 Tax=Rhizobium halophilum TaxID=2846852 RepID=UPI001EFDAAC7|nr:PAS domain-containing sensor histidine kinase [Rhizobium halophilum]MCF6370707.1 PAS domain S-box protein [Rhizobium halophilum]
MTANVTELVDHPLNGRYRLLVDAITDYAIYMLDTGGYVSSWNTGANRFKGYTEEEILGEHFSRFYTPEDREAGIPEKALSTAAATGRFEAEGWRVRKDGRRFWAHVIIDAIRDPHGQLLGFAKITRDLSERKHAEETLRKSEEQFRLLVQGVTDYAIYMLDPTGKVSSWNAGAEHIKGYAPDEIIGQHFSRFYTEEDRAIDLPRTALETAAKEGRFEKEGWRVRKDGTRFWANVIIDAIYAEDGSVLGFAKVTRDITEKREAQEALQLAQQELFQAQKMEAVGQLTGGVAHDFNNLLMAILGSLEIARKRALAGQNVIDLIDNAIKGAQRGASLTQRLLAFSRKQELKLEAVDVPDLVRGMAELLQRSLGPTVEISLNFPLKLPLVQSDPNQLASALLNLAVNARDAMTDGGMITIAARRRSLRKREISELKEGDYVCLSVTDEGEGMDAETLEKAMTPFFTTKGIGKGTGLGLPMVQGLMAQSGGKLRLRSTKGEGTTAELWLPLADVVEEPVSEAPQVEQPRYDRTLTVLAVDDDPLVITNTVLMLQDLGHEVVQAHSGEEALQRLNEDLTFDLVLTDFSMPRMTGAQLAEQIRERMPDLPIVLATGYAELADGSPGAELPRLAKPFSQSELEKALLAAVPY